MTKMTISEITHIVGGFKDMTLPEREWTHEAHLVTALSLLREHGLVKAEAMMPDMIRDYNTSRGGVNSDSEGYHHTITIFYLRHLDDFRRAHVDLELDALCAKALKSEIADRSYPLKFYSKDELFSVAARRNYVAPSQVNTP